MVCASDLLWASIYPTDFARLYRSRYSFAPRGILRHNLKGEQDLTGWVGTIAWHSQQPILLLSCSSIPKASEASSGSVKVELSRHSSSPIVSHLREAMMPWLSSEACRQSQDCRLKPRRRIVWQSRPSTLTYGRRRQYGGSLQIDDRTRYGEDLVAFLQAGELRCPEEELQLVQRLGRHAWLKLPMPSMVEVAAEVTALCSVCWGNGCRSNIGRWRKLLGRASGGHWSLEVCCTHLGVSKNQGPQ